MAKSDGFDIVDESPQCCGKIQVPTEGEVAALNAMREIGNEARSLKGRMQGLQVGSSERIELQEKIDRLKEDWNGWEEKRKIEAKKRMILLGHENPDPVVAP